MTKGGSVGREEGRVEVRREFITAKVANLGQQAFIIQSWGIRSVGPTVVNDFNPQDGRDVINPRPCGPR